jgi:hypothetical protein
MINKKYNKIFTEIIDNCITPNRKQFVSKNILNVSTNIFYSIYLTQLIQNFINKNGWGEHNVIKNDDNSLKCQYINMCSHMPSASDKIHKFRRFDINCKKILYGTINIFSDKLFIYTNTIGIQTQYDISEISKLFKLSYVALQDIEIDYIHTHNNENLLGQYVRKRQYNEPGENIVQCTITKYYASNVNNYNTNHTSQITEPLFIFIKIDPSDMSILQSGGKRYKSKYLKYMRKNNYLMSDIQNYT